MYDELIKELREYWNDGTEDIRNQAADAIEELQKQLRDEKVDNVNLTGWLAEEHAKHLWIPVTERLPEEDGKYLTVHTLNSIPPKPWIEVCWFAKNLKKVNKYDFPKKKSGFYQSDSEYGFYEVSGITHWQPLPRPPESEGE